ncbi:hypothetical protein PVE_R2G0236 [Pseudomonas veronii 1YdBTEX2]|uniref:Uncharacterized protein n=1 Tax=Pseudomonas veronii 1YdBTEX2 TaxID=1295141 RepID=A0A1D3K7N2_PSEVE|nr:hypothetical protein A7D21_32795 [Pseudomonas sp. AP19]SBW84265.1 hypothetical protein PVE_R2G0236 [Pseudomonas veronii 1YdBTEX2]
MPSVQINTSPLLRNFATLMPNTRIQVTTKIGPQTLLKTEFPPDEYPVDSELQLKFLLDLIATSNPGALDLIREVASRCVEDQRTAIGDLLRSATAPNSHNN